MLANQEEQWEKMKIVDFLSASAVVIDLAATNKKGALEELASLLAKEGKITDAKFVVDILLEREKLGSTGIGQGIAIPHAKTDKATGLTAAFGLSRRGIAFDSLDGELVHIFFLLVAPPDAAGAHLKALARISRLLKDKFIRQALREIKDVNEVIKIIRKEDQ